MTFRDRDLSRLKFASRWHSKDELAFAPRLLRVANQS